MEKRADEKFATFVNFKFHSLQYEVRTLLLAILVGIIGGLGAIVFRLLINFFFTILVVFPRVISGNNIALKDFLTVLSPTLGGLIVGAMVYYFASEAKGHGVPEIVEAVNLKNGRMRIRVPFVKIIASAITIGSGGSAGREGPIAQIGGGFASVLSQKMHLSAEESKTMVVAGVSAGIAATFNAPLGGVLFGIEIIRRDLRSFSVLPLVTASVIGTAIGDSVLGEQPAFIFPQYYLTFNVWNIPILIIFGGIMAVIAFLWVRGFYKIEFLFEKLPIMPIFIAGLGGLIVGILELFYPQVSGISYAPIDAAFALELPFATLLVLAIAKFLATSASIGSGGSGGVFAPTLFIGVMLGTAFGLILESMGIGRIPIPVMALLGMAALFSGAARAPLTAIIMTSEMTNDFQLILPLMFTVITAWVITSLLLKREDIYTLKLRARGVKFTPAIDTLEDLTVKEIMIKNPLFVHDSDTVNAVLKLIRESGHTGYPVMKGKELFGIVTEHDINKNDIEFDTTRVFEICCKEVIAISMDQSVSNAFLKMLEKRVNRLPVVRSQNSLDMVGWITRSDIMKAYWISKTLETNEEFGLKDINSWDPRQFEM